MQAVASTPQELLTDIPNLVEATRKIFHPLLKLRESDIRSVTCKTFKYGATDRHQLDIYFPPSANASKKAPVLFYVYGGGYASGNRAFPPQYPLIYPNVGAFFAKQGFATVIADYRLFPNIKFPDPAADIRDALAYVVRNADEINRDVEVQADVDNIFFLAHSAGAAIVFTMILLPDFVPNNLRSHIKGLLLQGGAYHHRLEGPVPPPVAGYYGSVEVLRKNEPLALLEQASEEQIRSLPPIVMFTSEKEPKFIQVTNADFRKTLNSRLGYEVPMIIMEGHNHISPHLALYSGEGEEWTQDVSSWIKSKL